VYGKVVKKLNPSRKKNQLKSTRRSFISDLPVNKIPHPSFLRFERTSPIEECKLKKVIESGKSRKSSLRRTVREVRSRFINLSTTQSDRAHQHQSSQLIQTKKNVTHAQTSTLPL